ncbi:sodium:proton antiporter [Thermococcus barophilus]|uniref:Membrane bound subgroup 4b [NiFe]-hydrogenase MBH(B)1, subunit Mbh(B)1G n=1 Tax=Thermococcus barophilus TaxID=55802 RepID=A0A0S1XA12_THEBA|nr:sodium:proton antiporter [Thermococcus barophilus]ALM74607.1 Membrane bound subgroup 4b [NiFe]-hydrogenase MBH(b)1, subunit Mbh(b)1G [Thermococcus barophilus]
MSLVVSLIAVSIAATVLIALYGVALRPNLVKKVVCLTLFSDMINVAVVFLGYRSIENPAPPVLTDYSREGVKALVSRSVDPLPQALTITAVVIGLAVTVLMYYGVIHIHRKYGTVDARKLARWEE